jgi:hypothetical protein
MGAREETRGTPNGHVDDELVREVRHAAGNLVQRIQYWTVLLEDDLPEHAREPLAGLKGSLDCLHRLIVRSLDLVRTTESRPMSLSIGDVAAAFALRFGAAIDIATPDATSGEVSVDPLILERALALIGEALVCDTTNGRAALTVARDPIAEPGFVVISLRAAWRSEERGDPFVRVQARVAFALALKLLDGSGFATHVDESDDVVELRVLVPLHGVHDDDATTHSARSRDSRTQLTL